MRIEIEIPKEFEEHFKQDKFKDSFGRIMEEIRRNLRSRYCSYAGRYEYETIEMLQKAFENSRKAYDVDKVVEELKEVMQDLSVIEIFSHIDFDSTIQSGLDNFLKAYNSELLRIVMQGGVSDDVCEREKVSSGYVGYPAYYSKCCTTNSNGLEMQSYIIADWKYCPYCGKKIKAGEDNANKI